MKNDIESFFKQVAGDLNLNPGTYIETSFLSFAPGIFSSVHVSKIKPEKPKAGSKSETHYVAHLDEEGNVKIIWGPGAAREEPKAKGLKTRCKHSKKIADWAIRKNNSPIAANILASTFPRLSIVCVKPVVKI